MNQFYYVAEEAKEASEGKPAKKEILGSFNVNMVVRTLQFENKCVILLNDFHEMTSSVPQYNKQGKPSGTVNRKEMTYSEIFLNEADSARYRALVEVGA